jgi:putative lipoic acid-binding regulatory protein
MSGEQQETLLEFPCDFPLKVMGVRSDDFAQTVVDIVLKHAPDYRAETVEMRLSGSGTYLSVTCTIRAVCKAQLDALYRELSGHPAVKVVL